MTQQEVIQEVASCIDRNHLVGALIAISEWLDWDTEILEDIDKRHMRIGHLTNELKNERESYIESMKGGFLGVQHINGETRIMTLEDWEMFKI